MSRAVKGLASKAAQFVSTPASSLKSFPPREAIINSNVFATPELWASLQKPPVSSLSAFVHRIGLANVIKNEDEIFQACTHSSYPRFYATHNPSSAPLQSNSNLAVLGNSLLGMFATEYLHTLYPHLPTRVLKAAVSAYVGPLTCAAIAKEMGAQPLLRWHRPVRSFFFFLCLLQEADYCVYPLGTIFFGFSDAYRCSCHHSTLSHSSRVSPPFPSDRTKIRALLFPESFSRLASTHKIPRSKNGIEPNRCKVPARTTNIKVPEYILAFCIAH